MEKQIEKQAIEEMAKVIERTEQIARDAYCGYPSPTMFAKDLYWHGYSKQSEGEGEWIFDREACFMDLDCFTCTKCKTIQRKETPYCPNCGAKMKGGAE